MGEKGSKVTVKMELEMAWNDGWTQTTVGQLEQRPALAPVLDCEAILVEAAQAGNLSAFNQMVQNYQDAVFGWVASLVKDEATAEDITQLTFITAYQKIPMFRGGSLRAWLFRIAHNRSIDLMRDQQRHPLVSLDGNAQDEDSTDLFSILPADGLLPEEAVIQAEQAERLQQLLDCLPEPFRHVLQLVDIYEMDYQEVAAILNVPLGTVKSRLARARLKLRDLVEQSALIL